MDPTAREQAERHIRAALDTGVRGEAREHLLKSLDAARGVKAAGLTTLHYDRLSVDGKLYDPDRPGLIMRHGKRTGRVWIYRHIDPLRRKTVELQFGTFPALGLAEARRQWSEMRERVRSGLPAAEDAESSRGPTMRELCDRYIRDYSKPFKRTWATDAAYLEKYVLTHYADLPATEFSPRHVAAILGPISGRAPREAEKVRTTLSGMFSVAIGGSRKIGTLHGETWLAPTTPHPVKPVTLAERKTRSHKPTRRELEVLLRNLEGDVGAAILLQAQTCARVTETAALPWSEVDLELGVWTLPAARAKNGHAHAVMLSRQSIALLEARLAARQTGLAAAAGAWVFPGRSAPHLTRNGVAKAFRRIVTAHGLPSGFTSHALRHACLTWLAENQCGKEIRDRISNHVDKAGRGADAIYNAAELNVPAREWLQRWCDHLDALSEAGA